MLIAYMAVVAKVAELLNNGKRYQEFLLKKIVIP